MPQSDPGESVDRDHQQQSLHTAGAVPAGSRVEGSPAVLSASQRIRSALLQQQLQHLVVVAVGGPVEGRVAVRVGVLDQGRVRGEQRPDQVRLVVLSGPQQSLAWVTLLSWEIVPGLARYNGFFP